jgi:hypothetical protein
MNFYPDLDAEDAVELLGNLVKKLVSKISGVTMGDIHSGNVRRKRKGWNTIMFVDLGY